MSLQAQVTPAPALKGNASLELQAQNSEDYIQPVSDPGTDNITFAVLRPKCDETPWLSPALMKPSCL